jgi:hypothetical protein
LQETVIGRPYLPGSAVVAAVEEHFKDAKVYVFKKKKRKRYTKLKGHRCVLLSTVSASLEFWFFLGEWATVAATSLRYVRIYLILAGLPDVPPYVPLCGYKPTLQPLSASLLSYTDCYGF